MNSVRLQIMNSDNHLTLEDLRVLEQLSLYPSAVYYYVGRNKTGTYSTSYPGVYSLFIRFEKTNSSAALDFDGAFPRIVSKQVIQKLTRLGILEKIRESRNSVFHHRCIINFPKLSEFEQTREIAVQIALGTWFKNADADWKDM